MKQTRQFAGAILLALGLVVATGVDVNLWQAPVAIAMMLVGGAWIQGAKVRDFMRRIFEDEDGKKKYDSIRHKMGRKSYGQAAIFMGTACVFVGTPKDCEERADDLWHYGQQVRVEENIDGMEFNIL